jgi:hypothetical protein
MTVVQTRTKDGVSGGIGRARATWWHRPDRREWTCIGGPEALINTFADDPVLGSFTRRVALGEMQHRRGTRLSD